MEFNEKLQELRKQKGLTQEELAAQLYVSRTAISKWESGRGFPNIDSLKAIASCFSVSVDDLLSGEELLAIAENEHKETARTMRDLLFGLLDCGMALLLFLPLFGQKTDGVIREVSLLALTDMQPYVRGMFWTAVCLLVAFGIMTLALQCCRLRAWTHSKAPLSLGLSTAAVLLFILAQQPYAAVFTFVFLIMKVLLLIKQR